MFRENRLTRAFSPTQDAQQEVVCSVWINVESGVLHTEGAVQARVIIDAARDAMPVTPFDL